MNEALEKLKEIGAQKIYENTHIPIEHVQAVLHESYDGLNKIQFMGFISILEREYGCDLKSVKLKGIAYFDGEKQAEEDSIFVNSSSKKNYKALYIIIAVIIFLVFLFMFYSNSNELVKPVAEENAVIQKVKEKVAVDVNETNVTDTNESTLSATDAVEEAEVQEPKAIEKSFVIKTSKKLWLGYIELRTNKKHQTVFTKEFKLDPNIDWLITLGHGYVDFEINGEVHSYKKAKGLKFVYKDGVLEEIGLKEFKRLNKGYVW